MRELAHRGDRPIGVDPGRDTAAVGLPGGVTIGAFIIRRRAELGGAIPELGAARDVGERLGGCERRGCAGNL